MIELKLLKTRSWKLDLRASHSHCVKPKRSRTIASKVEEAEKANEAPLRVSQKFLTASQSWEAVYWRPFLLQASKPL